MGKKGAFADQAIDRFFGEGAARCAFATFREMFRAVSEGAVDYGMAPVENSLAGAVYDNYDNFSRFEDVNIVGAITLRIEHSLLAVNGAEISTIKNVYSHPHGFPQCEDFLDKYPEWKRIEAESTADAAQFIARNGSVENAAIASGLAARYNNLIELARGIESHKRNYTRFVVIARENASRAPVDGEGFLFFGDITKASLIFTTKNKPGALYECLGVFHKNALNMTRLESRPMHGEPWRHSFYADIDVSAENAESAEGELAAKKIVDGVMRDLKAKTEGIRLLGLYRERDC